jgi:hypothetical protein
MCGTILAKNIDNNGDSADLRDNNGDSADLREIWVPEPKPVIAVSFSGFEQ